jgi:hypothetical protein
MTLRAVISVLLMFTSSACRVVSAAGSGQDGLVNVKEFGTKGNGLANDSAAI